VSKNVVTFDYNWVMKNCFYAFDKDAGAEKLIFYSFAFAVESEEPESHFEPD